MPQIRALFFIFLFWYLPHSSLFSQIIASATAGCAPLAIQFNVTPGATNILWNLGGASTNTSNLPNPNPIYVNPGNYVVSYTALVNSLPVSYSLPIIVATSPTGSFSYLIPSNRCAPLTATFTGSGGSPGSTYNWAFGDLTVNLNASSSVTHLYGPGNFSVVMIVVDAVSGCTAVATQVTPGNIKVSAKPNVVITSSLGFQGCSSPFVTSMTGTNSTSGSPIPGALTAYSWLFPGATPGASGLPTPGNVTFVNGLNTISLTVTDNNSCSNTGTAIVSVGAPSLSATVQPTVCVNSPIFPSVVATQTLTTWNFSGIPITYTLAGGINTQTSFIPANGTVPAIPSPILKYTTGGLKSYTVTINNGICPPTVYTNTFFVEQVLLDFSPNTPSVSCQPTVFLNYIASPTLNTNSSLSFTWEAAMNPYDPYNHITPSVFTTTNLNSPTYTMSQGSLNPYTKFNQSCAEVKLIAQSNSIAQCKSDLILYTGLNCIHRPTASFVKSVKEGCAPLVVTFTDQSVSSPSFPITGYTLHNGATPPLSVSGSSLIFPVTFTYTNPGIHKPYLEITTANGCLSTSFLDSVIVVNPPTVSGSVVGQLTVCAGNPVTINLTGTSNTPPSPNYIQHWHVETDNQFFSGCISDNSPTFPFTHIGVHPIKVSSYNYGCASPVVTLPQSITVKGPYGKFRYETNCTNKDAVTFTVHLQDVQTAILSFGDNTQQTISGSIGLSSNHIVTHNYPANVSADYVVTLNSANSLNPSCGVKTFTQQVKIRHPNANILFNGQAIPAWPIAMSCKNVRYNFDATTSIDKDFGCGIGYKWNFKTPNYTMPTIQTVHPNFGSPFYACYHCPSVTPIDTTIFDLAAKDTFRLAGDYTVSLTIRDVNGCEDTEVKQFRISSTKPEFTLSPSPLCLSDGTVQALNGTHLTQYSPDVITSYTWNFSQGLPFTTNNPSLSPTFVYNQATSPFQIFKVKCFAKNSVGCVDSTVVNLQVNNPKLDFQVSNAYPCLRLGETTSLSFSASPGFGTYSLSFGGPTPVWNYLSSFNNVTNNYGTPGVYVATLSAKDQNGCRGTEELTVTAIGQPTANMNFLNGNKFCVSGIAPVISSSSINVSPIINYFWSVNGPSVSATSIQPSISPAVTSVGIYTVDIIVSSGFFCTSSKREYIYVANPLAELQIDKTIFCLGDTLKVSGKNLKDVYGWQWFFGDNVPQPPNIASSPTIVNTPTVNYHYNVFPGNSTNGKTTLLFLYYDEYKACPRTQTTEISVINLNGYFIQSDSLYRHCLGLPDVFINKTPNPFNLSYSYNWNFGNQGTSILATPGYTFQQPGQYQVKMDITDTRYGCKGSAVKTMTILPLPKAKLTLQDSACREALFLAKGSGTPGETGQVTGSIVPNAENIVLQFNPQNTFTLSTKALVSSVYSLNVTDENGCVSPTAIDSIYIQQPAPNVKWDTTIVIGQTVQINAFAGSNFTYTWSPEIRNLSCLNCFNPVATSTTNISYSVMVADILPGCFKTESSYRINIIPKTSLDVPTAFTPDGDGVNDIIFPNGWGLRKLIYFKVFNRWGQLLFESNDITVGWDGNFNGVPQNMETYVYQVSVDTYTDEILTKSGTFKLIR